MSGSKRKMRFYTHTKNSVLLLSALLIVACQPPVSNDNSQPNDRTTPVDSPLTITADSVTMSPDYILNIKPSRYQPSLGLQGVVEPIRQSSFIAAYDLTVKKVMVTKGQWVEEGMPLFIVQKQYAAEKSTTDKLTRQRDVKNNNIQNQQLTDAMPEDKDNSNNSGNETVSDKSSDIGKKDGLLIDSKNEVVEDDNSAKINQNAVSTTQVAEEIVIRASFSGRVDTLNVQAQQKVEARTVLLNLSDDKDLRFTATLPIQAKSQLSVGQNVNFTTKDLLEKFTGQVSRLTVSEKPGKLLVYVHVIKDEASRDTLRPNMIATGRVDYGQIEVGNIVPKSGLHDVDLSILHSPPYQSLAPLTANIWVIKQDQRLTRQPIEIISYDPSTDQYLIAGISNDSLICLADLPVESAGKKVIIS